MTGPKITIGRAREQGSLTLTIYCLNHAAHYGGCYHSSDMTLMLALGLWGEDRRLDELPLRCSVCGSRKVDVRADALPSKHDGALDTLIQESWKCPRD
jgi:hypothetical protein